MASPQDVLIDKFPDHAPNHIALHSKPARPLGRAHTTPILSGLDSLVHRSEPDFYSCD